MPFSLQTHDPQHRKKLYDLRKTWIDVFPNEKLFALDRRVNAVDPAWPVAAPPSADEGRVIHVNPKFLKTGAIDEQTVAPLVARASNSSSSNAGTGVSKANSISSSSSPASSSSLEERRPPTEGRPVNRPLQLPLPPFYHDVPRPNEVNTTKSIAEPKVNSLTRVNSASALRDPRLKKAETDNPELVTSVRFYQYFKFISITLSKIKTNLSVSSPLEFHSFCNDILLHT